jgi:hypothetical protein
MTTPLKLANVLKIIAATICPNVQSIYTYVSTTLLGKHVDFVNM